MKNSYLLSLITLFIINTGSVYADNTPIQTNDASGSQQSTAVDQNGNLKVVPGSVSSATTTDNMQNSSATDTTTNPATTNTSNSQSNASPSTPTTSAPSAPSIPRPPAPLYGTVGGASVTQAPTPPAAPQANTSAVVGAPAIASPNKAIGTAQPIIPSQPRAQ